jgi:hypothetical protein
MLHPTEAGGKTSENLPRTTVNYWASSHASAAATAAATTHAARSSFCICAMAVFDYPSKAAHSSFLLD